MLARLQQKLSHLKFVCHWVKTSVRSLTFLKVIYSRRVGSLLIALSILRRLRWRRRGCSGARMTGAGLLEERLHLWRISIQKFHPWLTAHASFARCKNQQYRNLQGASLLRSRRLGSSRNARCVTNPNEGFGGDYTTLRPSLSWPPPTFHVPHGFAPATQRSRDSRLCYRTGHYRGTN